MPAVALTGPRQVGKTTLALAVQRTPQLFAVLRGQIDRARRAGQRHGLYLLLGSASMDLLRQSGESRAGRIAHLELAPLTLAEATGVAADELWLRGGFPESVLAADRAASLRWRQNFIRSMLERDVLLFSPRAAVETLRRRWTMLAHHQGGLLNAAMFARNLGVDGKTVAHDLDLLVDLMLVCRLPPWHANLGKRLVRTPKVYVRDAGAEIDLLVQRPGGERWAIEIERSLSPKLERGFHAACADVQPTHQWLVYPGEERYRIGPDVWAVSRAELARGLASLS
jgi:predicted AAA+ superfamily ATPase